MTTASAAVRAVYLTPDELAAMLNVPKATLYQWNRRGSGPAYMHLGRHVRYRLSDVEAWLDAQRAKSAR